MINIHNRHIVAAIAAVRAAATKADPAEARCMNREALSAERGLTHIGDGFVTDELAASASPRALVRLAAYHGLRAELAAG